MTLIFYAQPYDLSAEGFYFRSVEEYTKQAATLKNGYGDPVEEFEIQFIDGEEIDCGLAKAWGVNQANIDGFIEAAIDWHDDLKTRYIIAVLECGYSHDQFVENPDGIEIEFYEIGGMKTLAEQFVDEGLFGEIPKPLVNYIDLEAIARDLSVDYSATTIAGMNLIYRCG